MRSSLIVFWGSAGWCATLIIIAFRFPPLDIPEPPPRPNWFLPRALGVLGGIAGGWAFTQAFMHPVPWITSGPQPEPWMQVVLTAATTVGAVIGASLVTDVYGLIRGGRDVTRG